MLSVKKLERKIRRYAFHYYEGDPIVSDEEFDELCNRLKKLDCNNPLLHKVGFGYSPKENKVTHKHAIGGLEKVFELPNNLKHFIIEAKLDGITVVLNYEKGSLVSAVTRGNGITGLDISDRALRASGVTTKVKEKRSLSVYGELVCPNNEFLKFKKSGYANQRTAVAIVFRHDLSEEGLEERLRFIPFKAVDKKGKEIKIPQEFPFMLPTFYHRPENVKGINEWRGRLIYPADGAVLHYDNGKRIALKFKTQKVVTRIRKIHWEISNFGRFIPVAELTPVEIHGTIVSFATLFNYAYVKEHRNLIGAKVVVTKANEIIPIIIKIKKIGKGCKIPSHCPNCNHKLSLVGVHLQCESPLCSYRKLSRAIVFFMTMFPMDGIGRSYTLQFFSTQNIKSINGFVKWYKKNRKSNFSTLKNSEWVAIKKIRKALIKGKKEGLSKRKLASSLLISGVGETVSKRVVTHLKDIIRGKEMKYNIPQHALHNLYRQRKLIKKVLKTFTWKDEIETRIRIVITGSLSTPRDSYKRKCEEVGIDVENSVTNKTNYLVCNESSNSSKHRRAVELGVKIINENNFRSIISSHDSAQSD